jgi:hypothetical protein
VQLDRPFLAWTSRQQPALPSPRPGNALPWVLRERLVPVASAPGLPFDHGRFELVTELLDGAKG